MQQFMAICCGLTIGLDRANVIWFRSIPLLIRISPVIVCLCYELIYHLSWVYTETERQRKWFEEQQEDKKEIV